MGSQQEAPSYLTLFPNPHLDCHAEMYSLERVESLFPSHRDELLHLYYTHVHPSYPVLEPRKIFEGRVAERRVPSSLLAVVYNHGAQFWQCSPLAKTNSCPLQQEIRPWIFSCLSFEARTPNLAIVQATLLFMQMMPRQIRAPNHPGFWPMTNMLVGISQDIGLHVDPSNWSIVPSERKIRRILWWAVYTHDKWLSHMLGRPSHITAHNWNVKPLTLADFSDEDGRLPFESVSSAQSFMALCSLSTILADVSDSFYSIRCGLNWLSPDEVLNKAQAVLSQVKHWKEEYLISTSEGFAHQYLIRLATVFVHLSIQRAVFGALAMQQSERANSLATDIATGIRHTLFPILDSLEACRPTGLWLGYLRGNFAMIGSLLITLVLSSVDDIVLDERRALLLEFRGYLKRFTDLHSQEGCFEFARLPLRRLDLIMGELFQEDEMNPSLAFTPVQSDELELIFAS